MDAFYNLVVNINSYLSNYVLIFLLVGTGLWFSIRTGFVQVRFFGEGIKRLFGNFSLNGEKQEAGMTSFQALATASAEEIAQVEIATDTPESLQAENEEGLSLEGVLGTDAPEEALVERIALRDAFKRLGDREKQILSLRFYDGKTQMEVAGSLGISQAQVSRLEKSAIGTMRKSVSVC